MDNRGILELADALNAHAREMRAHRESLDLHAAAMRALAIGGGGNHPSQLEAHTKALKDLIDPLHEHGRAVTGLAMTMQR